MAKPNTTETPASNPPNLTGPKSAHWLVVGGIVAIVLATIFVYGPCRHGDFLWDGALLITNNPLVKAPDGLIRIWFSREPVDYWPVTNSMFWLQWHLFGNNPTGYHDTNTLLQIASALLVWTILRRLSVPGAFLAALLFAIHPVNVESVAWIAQLKNTLSMFFFLLSVLWFLNAEPDLVAGSRSTQPPRSESDQPAPLNFWYWLSLGAFTFAMLSKGSVAIQPLILLLIIWWKRNRITRATLLRTLPFFVVAAVLTVVNIWFQTHGSGETIRVVTPLERLLGAAAVPWFYLYKALVPLNLVFVYPQWDIQASNPLWWLPLIATVAVTALLLWQRNNTLFRPLLVAWVFFCAALLPVMGLIDITFMRFSLVADHYQYIAIISVLALLAAAVITLLHRFPSQLTIAVGAVLVIIVGFLAHQQTYIYLDSNTMYQSVIAKNPDCWLAYVNRGIGLSDAGDVDAAIASYQKALQIDPNIIEGQNGLGAALAKQGHYEAAIEHYRHALQIKPDYAEAHGNLGFALAKTGSSDNALKEMQLALRLNPDLPEVSFNLAHHFKQLGRFSEALQLYKHTVRLQPDNPQVHNNLGVLLAAMGNRPEAMQHYQESLRLDPKQAEAHCNLADALVDLGQPQQAIDHYLQALQIDANNAAAHNGLGVVYLNSQQLPQAIEQFQQALQSDPNFAKAHSNLGAALVQTGQPQQAIQHYREAIRLDPAYIEAYANLATTLAELDQRDEAIAAAEKAIALAQSSDKQTLAAQITSWLTDYRAHQSPPAASSTNSTRPTQKP